MSDLLLGIDIGTYSSKGVLVKPDGSLLKSHIIDMDNLYPTQPGISAGLPTLLSGLSRPLRTKQGDHAQSCSRSANVSKPFIEISLKFFPLFRKNSLLLSIFSVLIDVPLIYGPLSYGNLPI